jgi:hypothetical protein
LSDFTGNGCSQRVAGTELSPESGEFINCFRVRRLAALINFHIRFFFTGGPICIGPPEEGASGPVLWTDEIR